MSAFTPMPLPDLSGPKQNVLAQLMQQHQNAAMRFAGHSLGLGLNNPARAIAPPTQQPFGLRGVSLSPSAFGPTIARIRSVDV